MRLRIDKAVYGGAGLGRVAEEHPAMAGKTVFVPYTLPGELVECEITEDRRGFANARLVRVVEPSVERVVPGCEYFTRCGGCQYQHGAYDAQVAMKLGILLETLQRAGVAIDEDSIEVLRGEPWGYRNRIRLQIRFGDSALCYREAGSHRDVAVEHCPIAAPLLQKAVAIFPGVAQAVGLETGLFDEVEFFTNERENVLLASFWTARGNAATRALPMLCDALKEALPLLDGALLFEADSQKGQGRQQAVWGDPELAYTVAGRNYRVGAGAFFQVNRFLIPAMLKRVVEGNAGAVAWDLFAGVGLFASAMGPAFREVVAVEQSAASVRNLRQNLKGTEHRVVASSTLDFLREHGTMAKTPDWIVVDPPRAGLGKDVTALLSQIGAQKLTYISCDPSTLARDVQQLLHSGYTLRNTALVDLFPQTYHLETIVELERS